ncbi:uncharacterized protein RCC_04340 [Ramularia collo-cygni]|uniref:Integral membrane protein n=1 Tax=Ramularia collo-cygni TaxID=112498 RepID=A0A2D3UW84_9PEZI|nr:uncharacterized protein RCC_04340 [Ramularia collo-cygni]CZT18495.1 uncharacterized protein RCC_04340 [Ramularia collo-cygni]
MHKPPRSASCQRLCTSLKHILFFCTFYSPLILWISRTSARDPTSYFFNPTSAYTPSYSLTRSKQANALIKSAWLHEKTSSRTKGVAPQTCIAIPSQTHERARSLKTTIGSLLQGLNKDERDGLELKVLIAQLEPELHPAVREPWLKHTVDSILFYNETLSEKELLKIVDLTKSAEIRGEEEGVQDEKQVLDFAVLLRECHESGAEYIAIVEDDVLAMDGWLHRSLSALESAEEKAALDDDQDFLSLTLFDTELSLLSNPTSTTHQAFSSLFLVTFLATTLYTLQKLSPKSRIGRNITLLSGIWLCCIVTPFLITLYLAAGQTTTHPLHPGLMQPPNMRFPEGRTTVYPRHQAGNLLQYFSEGKRIGSVRQLVGEYAEENGLVQWSIVPSVLQHLGREGPPETKEWERKAEMGWNIGFEEYSVEKLREEHEMMAGKDDKGRRRG